MWLVYLYLYYDDDDDDDVLWFNVHLKAGYSTA